MIPLLSDRKGRYFFTHFDGGTYWCAALRWRATYPRRFGRAWGTRCCCALRRLRQAVWRGAFSMRTDFRRRRMNVAYVPVPKDLTKVRQKLILNLTKRQVICFSGGALIGVPLFFLTKNALPGSMATFLMILSLIHI